MIADCVPHETQAERMLMRGVAVKSVCWRIPRWAEDHGLPFNLELVLENLRDELAGRPSIDCVWAGHRRRVRGDAIVDMPERDGADGAEPRAAGARWSVRLNAVRSHLLVLLPPHFRT